MNLITRRGFLERHLRLALFSALAAGLNVPAQLHRALAQGAPPSPGRKKLLFIFLRGGNDGLNTLVPWGDDAYSATNRPSLYLPKPDPLSTVPGRMPEQPDLTRAIDLGNGFAGLHPAMKDLAPLYNSGQLALVHRVGYPKQSRSHFDSQRYWENGMPRQSLGSSGILYRAVVDTGLAQGLTFPAVSVQSSNPLILRGPLALPNLSDPTRYGLLGVADNGADKAKLLAAITSGHHLPFPTRDNRPLLFNTGAGLSASIDELKTVGVTENAFFDTDGTTHLFPIDAASNQKAFSSSAFGFFRSLKTAAQILAKTGALVAGTQIDGFDTHNQQGAATGGQANLLARLAWGCYAVRQYLQGVDPALWDNTVIVTLSEFGRTSKENGSQGTDHAEACAMLVAGGKIRGGVYQCSQESWPIGPNGAMFKAEGRYLGRSVDYRSVMGELVRDHLGVQPAQLPMVIPGYGDEAREHLAAGGTAPDGVPIVGELGLI